MGICRQNAVLAVTGAATPRPYRVGGHRRERFVEDAFTGWREGTFRQIGGRLAAFISSLAVIMFFGGGVLVR